MRNRGVNFTLILIHTSDLHIIPSRYEKSALGEAYIAVLEEIGEKALNEGAKYLLVAGDFFNEEKIPYEVLVRVIPVLKRLREQGLRVVVVPGNHDYSKTRGNTLVVLSEAGLIHLLNHREEFGWLLVEPLVFEDDKLVFYGIPGFKGASNKEIEYLSGGKTKLIGSNKYGSYDIIVLAHLSTKFYGYDPSKYSDRYGSLYLDYESFLEKLPVNTKYIALGHIHIPIPLNTFFKGKAAYPGAPIGMDLSDFKETYELGKSYSNFYRRILRVDISGEIPEVKALRLESTPRVYYMEVEANTLYEARAEISRQVDAVEPGKYTVIIAGVKGIDREDLNILAEEFTKRLANRKIHVILRKLSTGQLEGEILSPIEITPEKKSLSIEEIELQVIREYLEKKRVNIQPEKIQWLINNLGRELSGSIGRIIEEIEKNLGEEQ